jgi:hypothetical protein
MGFFLSHANIVTFALLIEDIENYKDLFMFIFETIIYYVNKLKYHFHPFIFENFLFVTLYLICTKNVDFSADFDSKIMLDANFWMQLYWSLKSLFLKFEES